MDVPGADIDSASVGDATRHLSYDALARADARLPGAPPTQGRLALIVRRTEGGGRREMLESVRLTPEDGVPGDAWGWCAAPHRDGQITVMERDVAEMIANGQPLALFGDNLFVDLDLSAARLPSGSRVRIGEAVLEVTPKPHDGCRKFLARFGKDALRFVAHPDRRARNLRGIYMRVLESGTVCVGDPIEVLSRGALASDTRDRSRSRRGSPA